MDVPIGDWAGRLGRLMRVDVESGVQGITTPLVQYHIATQEEAQEVVAGMSHAMRTYQGNTSPFYYAYGQKPLMPGQRVQ